MASQSPLLWFTILASQVNFRHSVFFPAPLPFTYSISSNQETIFLLLIWHGIKKKRKFALILGFSRGTEPIAPIYIKRGFIRSVYTIRPEQSNHGYLYSGEDKSLVFA